MTRRDDDLLDLKGLKRKAQPDIQVQSLKRELKKAKNELRQQEVEYGDLKGYFSDVCESVEEVGIHFDPATPVYNAKKLRKKPGSPVSAVMQWTDWHMGAVQDSSEIEGLPAFSPEVLEHRVMEQLLPSFLGWIEAMRNAYSIPTLHIICTGDFISGDIHEELKITNAFPTPRQAVEAGKLVAQAVAAMSPFFENVIVEWLVADNHSRLTHRPQAKQEGYNSHNYTVGIIAEMALKDIPNVDFRMHPVNRAVVKVENRQYLLTHGHDVRGWAGHPWYGWERSVGKEAQKRLWEPDENKFHIMLFGHFHTPIMTPRYWGAGSLQGTDAYDHKNGRHSEPSQPAWLEIGRAHV